MRPRLPLLLVFAIAGVLAVCGIMSQRLPARASSPGTTVQASVGDSTPTPDTGDRYVWAMSAGGRAPSFPWEERNFVLPTATWTATPTGVIPTPTVTGTPTAVFPPPAPAGATQRVSVDSAGVQGNAWSGNPSISANGRYVAMDSDASNLVTGDTNGRRDVFVRDRVAGATERVSVDGAGAQGNGGSAWPAISADGRYVVFISTADNLVPGDVNGTADIFVRDRLMGSTDRVSVSSVGDEGNGASDEPSISADGRYVAFVSTASNLVPGDTNAKNDIFVHDRDTGATERVSVDSVGAQGNGLSAKPSIDAAGRYVAFDSLANNLVSGDTNGAFDVFVHDRDTGATERVSVDSTGAQGNDGSYSPSLSADGRCVVFYAFASNLVFGDTNGIQDVFVRDRVIGATERVSVDSAGAQGNSWSDVASISADGRHVGFTSSASNLVPGDTNGAWDVFDRDRVTGVTERVSVDSAGAQGTNHAYDSSNSEDGHYVAFSSSANNLVPGDTNGATDVFVRNRVAGGPVGGVAEQLDATGAAAPSRRDYAVYMIGVAAALLVAAVGGAFWRKRRA